MGGPPGGYLGAVAPNALFPKKKKKKKATKRAEWTTNCTNNVKKLSLEVSRVDIVQFSIRLAIPPRPEISSVESKTAMCPRQRLGVFNAQPSRHVRLQDDLVCSRGSSVTWDPQVDT